MPMHDWTRVEEGIYHAFHHGWIHELSRSLNQGILPKEYYALPEQVAAGVGPDVLTLQSEGHGYHDETGGGSSTSTALAVSPTTRYTAETEGEFYRRKKSALAIRHVSGDRIVAMIEIISPGNKGSRHTFATFVDKVCELLESRIHLLIVDPFPPTSRDPNGVHAAIWRELAGDEFTLPADKPLTLVAYESDLTTRAFIEPIAIGEALPEMPLFLEPHGCVRVPLETTYMAAYANLPSRWQRVLN